MRDVQLLTVDPPADVIDAFNDVQRARQDRDRLKNEAEAFSNDIVPRARGEAAKLVAEAEAYKLKLSTVPRAMRLALIRFFRLT